MDVLIWSRVVERALSVVIGGLCIFLGYRLFIQIPRARDSEGKLDLPGGISIFLTRVGPGVFFALFGAGLVGIALQRALELDAIQAQRSAGPAAPVVAPLAGPVAGLENVQSARLRYAAGNAAETLDAERRASLRAEARRTMAELAALEALLPSSVLATRRVDVQQAVREARLALMQGVWAADWGDWEGFRQWTLEAGSAAPPPGVHADALATWRQVRK